MPGLDHSVGRGPGRRRPKPGPVAVPPQTQVQPENAGPLQIRGLVKVVAGDDRGERLPPLHRQRPPRIVEKEGRARHHDHVETFEAVTDVLADRILVHESPNVPDASAVPHQQDSRPSSSLPTWQDAPPDHVHATLKRRRVGATSVLTVKTTLPSLESGD